MNKSNVNRNLIFTKKINIFNTDIKEISIFNDKKVLVWCNEVIKIYNDNFNLIFCKIENDINYVKIIDNNNIIYLCKRNKLITINLKEKKIKILFSFKEKIYNLIYLNNYTLITNNNKSMIKVWKLINNSIYQITTIFKLPSYEVSITPKLDLINDNLLMSFNPLNLTIYFCNLKIYKFDHYLNLVNEDLLYFCKYKENIIFLGCGDLHYNICTEIKKYNVKEKKILDTKNFNYFIKDIKYIYKKDVILITGGDIDFLYNVYMYDENFNLLHIIDNERVYGFSLFEKYENESNILAYNEKGEIYFYSIN